MDTEEALKQHTREYYRNMYRRDRENEGRMTAAEFARLHKINPWALRRRMRLARAGRRSRRLRMEGFLEKY